MKEPYMKKEQILICLLLFIISLLAPGCSKSAKSGNGAQATLNLASSKQGQSIGFVDVDGDGILDKVVGAPYSSTTESQTGSVLVYRGTATGFSTIPDMVLTGDDNLGYSFVNVGDVDGDGKPDFAISAIHGDGADVSLSGSVTIYKGGSNGQVIKKLWGDGPMDKFGVSVAVGDLNGDGKPDIIVGAPFNTNDPALYQSGSVNVFFGPDFTVGVKLYASSANKGLGWAVSAGDVNGDGTDDLIISASGKVLVFFGGNPFAPAINAPDITITGAASGFGKSIAVIGDVDGDGKKELAIGAPNAVINNNRDTGSVYVVKGSAAGTVNVDAATPPASLLVRIDGEGPFNRFGSSLASLGDFDADGKPDFAAGAPMADVTTATEVNILSGKVYVFKGKDIAPSTTIANASVFPGKVKDQGYGTSLAANNGKLLIGGPRSEADAGSVNIVDLATGQTVKGGGSGGVAGGISDCCY
jgi:FG-GAP repeat protein/VCBS repeat protein